MHQHLMNGYLFPFPDDDLQQAQPPARGLAGFMAVLAVRHGAGKKKPAAGGAAGFNLAGNAGGGASPALSATHLGGEDG
jgi:hypothetical protein